MKNHSEGEAVNTTTPPAPAQGVLIMQRVARSLVAAEMRAVELPGTDADQCDFAVCAALLTSQALQLLPPGVTVDDIAAPAERDPVALLRGAERLLRGHPPQDLPPGTTILVDDLRVLIGRSTP